jgi:two-component system response regulator MprA
MRNDELRDDCRVLVVDDDPTIRETVREALAWEGYTTLTAPNGREALEQVAAHRPHVVLLDMRMPVMDGWEVARHLKERGLRPKIVTVTAAVSARTWAREIGADAYLAKPFDLDRLLAVVAACCSDARIDGSRGSAPAA